MLVYILSSTDSSLKVIAEQLSKPDILQLVAILMNFIVVPVSIYLTSKVERSNFQKQKQFEIEQQIYNDVYNRLTASKSDFDSHNKKKSRCFYNWFNFINRNLSQFLLPFNDKSSSTFGEVYRDYCDELSNAMVFHKNHLRALREDILLCQNLFEPDHDVFEEIETLSNQISSKLKNINTVIGSVFLLHILDTPNEESVTVVIRRIHDTLFPFNQESFSDNWRRLHHLVNLTIVKAKKRN